MACLLPVSWIIFFAIFSGPPFHFGEDAFPDEKLSYSTRMIMSLTSGTILTCFVGIVYFWVFGKDE